VAGYEIIKQGRVVGVVEDFHTSSLHVPIEPVILHMPSNWDEMNSISIRVKESNMDETLQYIEETMASFAPDWPFSYFFLDDNFASQYQTEQKLGQIFIYFSGLAILIACLGLLGLASFSTEQRTKEIAIRKVVGASVWGIILQLSKDFLILVGLGFTIAAPIAYFSMEKWLSNFAYPVGMSPSIFLISAFVCMVVAWLTIGWQAMRAATANPVESLRTE
ncbi:MAG: ABC transporter permease, partial [Calditrichaeota bacterium]|nr:ABC transporter permease [Calditrichota bacterium]